MKYNNKFKGSNQNRKAEKPMKRLTLNLLFRESSDLADLFTEVRRVVSVGVNNYSRDTQTGAIDLRVEYSKNHQYQERIIHGDVCYVYKSKI